jgi:hypothetical protein
MPFTDPVVESITANIASELAEITVAAGWNYTLVPMRPKDVDFEKTVWDDLTVLIVQGESVLDSSGNGLKAWTQHYSIIAIVTDGDNSDDPIDTKKNRVAADIEKKLMEVPRRGHANCVWTSLVKRSPFRPGNGGVGGISVEAEVLYQTQLTNPYA